MFRTELSGSACFLRKRKQRMNSRHFRNIQQLDNPMRNFMPMFAVISSRVRSGSTEKMAERLLWAAFGSGRICETHFRTCTAILATVSQSVESV